MVFTQSARSGETFPDFGPVWDKLYRTAFLKEQNLRFTMSAVSKCAWLDTVFTFQAIGSASRMQGLICAGYHYRIIQTSSTRRYNAAIPEAYATFFAEIRESAERLCKLTPDVIQAMHARAIGAMADSLRRCFFHPKNPDVPKLVAEKIRAMKSDPFIREAIDCKSNRYFSTKAICLKHLLRLPWIWPLRLITALNAIDRKRKKDM